MYDTIYKQKEEKALAAKRGILPIGPVARSICSWSGTVPRCISHAERWSYPVKMVREAILVMGRRLPFARGLAMIRKYVELKICLHTRTDFLDRTYIYDR